MENKYSFEDFDEAKIDTKEEILAFVRKCQDFASNDSDFVKSETYYTIMLNKIYSIIDALATSMENLRNDFEKHGTSDKVNNLRTSADDILKTAVDVLLILDILPNEFTTKNECISEIKNAVSVWARFAVTAKKLVSVENIQTDIYYTDKFLGLVSSSNENVIRNAYEQQIELDNDCFKAVYNNHIAHGKFKLAKLIIDVFTHQPITQIDKRYDTRQTTVDLIDRQNLLLFIPAFAAPFIGFFLYGKLAMVFCVLLVGVIQVLFIWPFLRKTIKKTISVSKMNKFAESEKGVDITIRFLSVILGLLNIFPFLASSTAFMQAIHGESFKAYEGGTFVSFLTLIIMGVWFFNAYAMPKPEIIENQKLFNEENITMEEKIELEKMVKEDLAKEADKLTAKAREKMEEEDKKEAEKKYGKGCKLLLYNHFAINDATNEVYINEHKYKFHDILAFEVRDNPITINSAATSTSNSVSTAKTDTGNMLGRAVVGGLIAGSAGAIIGATTAKKTMETATTTVHSTTQSSVVHDYSVVITVNNISSPTEIINLGQDETALNKIVSTLTVILNRNSQK